MTQGAITVTTNSDLAGLFYCNTDPIICPKCQEECFQLHCAETVSARCYPCFQKEQTAGPLDLFIQLVD